ncbi:MAG TPA: hypothetical protein VK025_05440 [Steroidobacter sp.]|jgi:hypothetical protein|nr:hypothetical protein [Steroidobacteraceae bacterium]HLS80827.1 hypothetical protein [Steroidobacter sp.]
MCLADYLGNREVVTAAATAEVPDDKPAICGTVTLHCLDDEDALHLSMPMLDALLLLNSLRAIEAEFQLQEWSAQIGSSLGAIEEMAAELRMRYSDENEAPARTLN